MQRGRCRSIGWAILLPLAVLFASACGDGKKGEEDATDTEEDEVEDTTAEPDVPVDTGPDTEPDTEPDSVPDTVEEDVIEEDAPPDGVTPVNCDEIADWITADGLLVHLQEFEDFATAGDGSRAAGTAGWDDSIDYVEDTLVASGYTVTPSSIEYPYFEVLSDPVLERTLPTTRTYTYCTDDMTPTGDFQKVNLSPPGNVTATVTAVDLQLGPGNTSTSACETTDFTGFPTGSIALIQRGTCYFITKVLNAQAAGASAVLLFNQGNTTAREGLMVGGVGMQPAVPVDPDHGVTVPVLFATYAVGAEIATLLASGAVTLHLQVNTIFEIRTTENIVVETAGGAADEVVMFGGHLDTVPDVPGINDNASGVAAVLEIARAVAECEVTRKMRFAFWGGEEWDAPWGSIAYVNGLTETERGNIYFYINADMIGSPNYSVFVYDGDGSVYGVPGVPPSADIERFFASDLLLVGLPHIPFFSDASDHFAFYLGDVAYGGLFTGASELKTAEEVPLFGGTADAPYDACWHEACDDVDNVDLDIAETMAKSLARAAQYFGIDGLTVPPAP